jgi:hypothetical protein
MIVVRSHRTRAARGRHALLASVGALLVGCHGSTIFQPGTPVLTMGESYNSNDFAGYQVNIDGITLTDNNNNVVTLLGVSETVDLTKLNHLTELVEAPAIPAATYVTADVTIDYTYEVIYPIVGGQPVPSTVLDESSGAVATTYSVVVTFDPDHPLVITNQQSTRLQIDIDLPASNSINTSTSPVTVSVQPFITMSPVPVDNTVMRARGLFVTTQSVPSGFYMNMRPFYDQVSALGALIVNTNAQTYYNINGIAYTGAAGLAQVTQLQVDSPIAAYGTLDNLSTITPTFNATSVYAGTSLESDLDEAVSGVVSARTGASINLLGVTYLPPPVYTYPPIVNGTAVSQGFYPDVPVTLGPSTIVNEDGVNAVGLTADSISVGQQVTVFGQATVNPTNGKPLSIDATQGLVRLNSSPVWGTLNSATSDTASLNLLAFDSYPMTPFIFTGTGATPTSYQVATGSLNESGVAPGTLLKLNGVVAPFGSAPANFVASSITPGSATVQRLVITWNNVAGAATPFTKYNGNVIVVDRANPALALDSAQNLRTGPNEVQISSLPESPPFTITTAGADPNNLVLAVGSATLSTGISVFNSAARFASGLNKALNGNRVYRLVAYGQYDGTTNTFIASRIYVALWES